MHDERTAQLFCKVCGAGFASVKGKVRSERCLPCRRDRARELERRRYEPEARHQKHARRMARTSLDDRRSATVLRWDEHVAQKAERGRARLATNRALIGVALAEGCLSCGELDPVVLEFDHVRGDKARNVTETMGAEALRAEIAKCDVRCANCHVRRHRTPQNLGLRR